MSRWLLVAVLVLPMAAWPDARPSDTKNLAFLVTGAGAVVCLVRAAWLRALCAWTAVSALCAASAPWALWGLAGVLAWALLHQQAAALSPTSWRKVRAAIAAAALVQIAWLGAQALGLDPLFVPTVTQGGIRPAHVPLTGWFGNPMDLALFLGLSLPALVAVSPWLLLPAAAALLALQATAGFVCAGTLALWLALIRLPRWCAWMAVVGILGLVVAAVLVRDPQGLGRRPTGWAIAARLAWERPLVGWGPNAVDHRIQIVDATTNNRWNFFFNEWLQGAVELGVIGPALAAGYLVSLARRLRGRWLACGEALPAALALLAVSLFSIPLRIGPTALLAALYLGRLESIAQEAA